MLLKQMNCKNEQLLVGVILCFDQMIQLDITSVMRKRNKNTSLN